MFSGLDIAYMSVITTEPLYKINNRPSKTIALSQNKNEKKLFYLLIILICNTFFDRQITLYTRVSRLVRIYVIMVGTLYTRICFLINLIWGSPPRRWCASCHGGNSHRICTRLYLYYLEILTATAHCERGGDGPIILGKRYSVHAHVTPTQNVFNNGRQILHVRVLLHSKP